MSRSRTAVRAIGAAQSRRAESTRDDAGGWQDRARCRSVDPDLFHPNGQDQAADLVRLEAARNVCAACPVTAPCLEFALTAKPPVGGIWAGTTERERRRLRRNRQKGAA